MKHDTKPDNIIRQKIDTELSFLDSRPSLHGDIMSQIKGVRKRGITMRKSLVVPVLLVIFLLMGSIAFAATALLNYIFEKAIDMETEQGSFCTWKLDDKVALINLLSENGWSFSETDIALLNDDQVPNDTKEKLVTKLIEEEFGREDAFSHIDIIEQVKGPMQMWSLEDKAWYSSYIRSQRTFIDSWEDVLPDESDLTQEEAVAIAKKAILEAHPITEEELEERFVSVDFFTNDEHLDPCWRVSWLTAPYGSTEYTVLMTRAGEIIEDPKLGVYTPDHMALLMKQNEAENTTVDPAYPTGRQDQWSLEDKAKWLGNDNGIPSVQEISEEMAVAVAQEAITSMGIDLQDYEISVWYKLYDYYDTSETSRQTPFYVVYYIDDFDAPMNVYSVLIDPNTGTVIQIFTPDDSLG